MGFWNKLGKIALQAAPYVAAPFTGGASLMATGATQKLGQKWAEHDAKKAIEKGIAPSKFDKYLGMASAGAGLGSIAFGGALSNLGKAGSVGAGVGKGANLASIAGKAAPVASKAGNVAKIASAAVGKGNVGGWQGALGKAVGNAAASKGVPTSNGGWEGQLGNILQQATAGDRSVPIDASPHMANLPQDTTRPTPPINGFQPLSGAQPRNGAVRNSIFAGRNEALMNQPWRAGYNTNIQGPEDDNGVPSVITAPMSPIYPNFTPPIQSPPISESGEEPDYGDKLTPRTPAIRRRKPVVEEEAY
jgi:hypothetical protein